MKYDNLWHPAYSDGGVKYTGITYKIGYEASWSVINSPVLLELVIKNSSGSDVYLRNLTVKVAKARGGISVYGDDGSAIITSGGDVTATIYDGNSNKVSYAVSPDATVGITTAASNPGSHGSPSSSGYFDSITTNREDGVPEVDSQYNVEFNFAYANATYGNWNRVKIPSDNNEHKFWLKRSGSENLAAISTRRVFGNYPLFKFTKNGASGELPKPSISKINGTSVSSSVSGILNYRTSNTIEVTKMTGTNDTSVAGQLLYSTSRSGTYGNISYRNTDRIFTRSFSPSAQSSPQPDYYFKVKNDGPYYPGIIYSDDTIHADVKLGKPNSPTLKASGVSVGSQVSIGEVLTFSTNGLGSPNPSGTSLGTAIWYNGSTQISPNPGSSYTVTSSPSPGGYYVSVRNTCSSYVSSDYVNSNNKITTVIFCPEKMAANGFTYSFKHTDNTPMVAGEVIVPGSSLKVSWSSFPISKHLGSFQKYDIGLVKGNTSVVVQNLITGGTNDPSSNKDVTVVLQSGQALPAGNDYRLRLTAYYDNNNKTTTDNSNVFESPSFILGGKPEIEIEYPSGTTSGSRATTCNENPRLVFSINPGGFSGVTLTSLKVSTDDGTSWTTHSPVAVGSNILYCRVDADGTYHIVYVLPTSSAATRNIKIKCTNNSNIDSDEIAIYLQYSNLTNVQSGQVITASKVVDVATILQGVTNSYPSKYKQTPPWSGGENPFPFSPPSQDDLRGIEIRKMNNSNVDFLYDVMMLAVSVVYYNLLSDNSCTVKLLNGNYVYDPTKEIDIFREAGLSRGDYANAYGPIDTSNPQYYVGNILNHIIDGLKYML